MPKSKRRKVASRKTSVTVRHERKNAVRKDKEFAAAYAMRSRPHMEWQDDIKEFAPSKPKSAPFVNVDVELMHAAHEKLGVKLSGSRKGVYAKKTVRSLADSGCMTCTAGKELLEYLNCPEDYLIPCSHRILGITHTSLNIMGAIFARITFKGRTSRQMIYISENIKGFFLSESALRDLEIIHQSFPDPLSQPSTAMKCGDVDEECKCPQRSVTPAKPEVIPFEPVEANIPKLEQYLLDTFESSAFNTCTYQKLQAMEGPPVQVFFKEGAVPSRVHTPIQVPVHQEEQTKAILDLNVRIGIIEPVPAGVPVTWCSRMLTVGKSDGGVRIVQDYQKVNEATLRETHHTPSPFSQVSLIPSNTYKTTTDAWNGYHSLPLDPSAKDATTFITKWGRYRYCRAPQGFHASGDAYTKRFDDITAGQPRVARVIDDSLLWDCDIESAFWHTFEYLKLCADKGIVFNREKFKFARKTVEFAGFEITEDGYRPPKKLIQSIKEFPTPKDITGIRSWFGLVNQVAYTFMQTEAMAPFRELLSSKTSKAWFWDETMTDLFNKSKHAIIEQIQEGVKTFEKDRPTVLSTDWSRTGIGFTLQQKHCRCSGEPTPLCGQGHWKMVYAGSRFTKGPETRYAPIEGEALAVTHGLKSCRYFIMGCPNLILAVDHKPLIKIFNDRSLESISNPRLVSLKEKTLMYSYRIMHIPGKQHAAPDHMSRYPSDTACDDVIQTSSAHASMCTTGIQSVSWDEVKREAEVDEECVTLADTIMNGFPDSKQLLPNALKQFWHMRDDLYVVDNVPMVDGKTLIPTRLRSRVLEGLHMAHQGVNGMLSNARQRIFWPGLDAAIRQTRAQCKVCNETAPSQKAEPMLISSPPDIPFQQVVMDFANIKGKNYIIYADRLSGWVEVVQAASTSFKSTYPLLLRWFRTFGVPEEISTDGGPPFNGLEFREFLKRWSINWRLSSAHYAQSNGRAEAAVKSAKRILTHNITDSGNLDTEAATQAMLLHRNTPAQGTNVAPAVMLYGKILKDHLPSDQRNIRREWREIAESREKALSRRLVTPSHRSELAQLEVGEVVQVQNQCGNAPKKWNNTGQVVEVLPNRQYRVMMDGSRHLSLRNRKFLKPISPLCRKETMQPRYSSTPYDTEPADLQKSRVSQKADSPVLQIPDDHVVINTSDSTPQRSQTLTPRRRLIMEKSTPESNKSQRITPQDSPVVTPSQSTVDDNVEAVVADPPILQQTRRCSNRARRPPMRLLDYKCS